MRYTPAVFSFGALALLGCSGNATRQAYEGCLANQRVVSPRDAKAFCACLRKQSNLDMRAAHPAEECAESAEAAGSSRG